MVLRCWSTGRYLSIQRLSRGGTQESKYLQLMEVQVRWHTLAGWPGLQVHVIRTAALQLWHMGAGNGGQQCAGCSPVMVVIAGSTCNCNTRLHVGSG